MITFVFEFSISIPLNKVELHQFIQFPETIQQDNLSSLKELVTLYPYCSTFQSLYLKGLQNTSSLQFENQLSHASLYAADRSKLYQLCYQSKLKAIIEKVEESTEEPAQPIAAKKEVEEPTLHVAENQQDKETPLEDTQVDTTELIDKKAQQLFEKDALLRALEEDILIEVINNSIQMDVEEAIQSLNEEAEKATSTKPLLEEKAEPDVTPKETVTPKAPKRFSDWLTQMQPVTTEQVGAAEKSIPENNKPLTTPQELIDRFLKVENTKIVVRKEPMTPQQLSKMGLVENESFVTETLANIYAAQGNFLKSIKIYEQLMLTIPEKKVFFASRIRFLREKMEYEP